ncbi:hypothetical protein LY90DRAFT_519553 [Neocallimastix californiae]|uniref:Uncharacterized protein n=1 Tax=Neocallimastix californiae TaxID=1754190 RepID=A0A1Y1YZ72_9FUNG|nr:hypothetical protein LY90DRAFT_519553 [Neocallimastix californiae]|eukprot:ORY03340.1 hypothetical protein LY90DRAFT_519553 [Neocallimastix californiae]
MKLLFIILSFCLIIKAYSSGQNHTPTDFVLLILSSADENCIIKSKCGPKLDPNTSKPYIYNIADTNSLHNIRVSIYDIIPELRYFSEEEAKIFYENVLFPSAKKAFNEYFGFENYDDFDNMSHDDKIRIKDYITEKIDDMTNRRDVIRELLSSSGNIDKIAFINDGKTKSIYYYGDNSDTNNFYNSFLDYLNDQGTINDFVNQITSNDNDISKSAIQNIAVLCKRRISCKQYFKDANKDQLKFTIIKSINNNNENNYHLIINDLKNERLIHPFTLTEKTKNGEQIFTMNTNFIHKEIPFYNYHAFSSIDIERYKKEIINQINENFKYGNIEDITLQKDIESYSRNNNNPNLLERIKYRIYNILDKTLNSNNENKLSSYDIQKLVDFINDIDNIDNKNKEKKLFKNIIGNILSNNNIGDEKNINSLVNNLYDKLDTNDEGFNNQSILQILFNIKNYDYENTVDNTNITFKNKIEEIVRKFLIDNGYETLADINKVIRDISKQIYDENFLMNKNIEYMDSKFLNSISECIINNLEKILYEELDKKDSQLNNKSILKIMNNINSNSKKEHNYESTIENTNITIKNKIEETVRKILNDNGYETLADIDKVVSDISKNIYDKNLLMNENAEYKDSKFKYSIRESIIENQRINEHINNQASSILNESKETLVEKSKNYLLDIINKESRNGVITY